jgi:hypothetical protein
MRGSRREPPPTSYMLQAASALHHDTAIEGLDSMRVSYCDRTFLLPLFLLSTRISMVLVVDVSDCEFHRCSARGG